MSFEYNSSGLRTKKVVGDKTTEFYYSGNLLVAQYDGTHWIKFIYTPDGEIVGFTIHDDQGYYDYCYYLKNIQGDIIGIYSNIFQIFREYSYDAWGNVTGIYDEYGRPLMFENDVAHFNPLRYRGYYYDTETELYYLNSRYYNPKWGSFISADGYVSTGEQIVAKNMYAYCLNNPVNYADPSGTEPVDIDMAEGLGYILDLCEFALQLGLGAVGHSFSTAVRPSNIGAGLFNKQVAQSVKKVSSYSLKVGDTFDFLGYLVLALDLSMIVDEHLKSEQSVGGVVWDITIDSSFTVVNFLVAAKFGAAVGTALCPGLGTAVGMSAGVFASVIVGAGLDYLSQRPKGALKSWIN